MALSKAEIYQRHKDRYHNDPEYRAKILQQKADYNKRRRSDPATRERLNQYNRDNKEYFNKKAKEYNSARPFHYAFRRLNLRAKQNDIPFDLDEEYTITKDNIKSKSINTPFLDTKCYGVLKYHVLDGVVSEI